MKVKIKSINELSTDLRLDPEHLAVIDHIKEDYEAFLGQSDVRPLSDLVDILPSQDFQKGDLVFRRNILNDLNVFKASTQGRGQVFKLQSKGKVNSSFLLWYFSVPSIKKYIECFSLGHSIQFIPMNILNNLMVPTKFLDKVGKLNIVSIEQNPISEHIKSYLIKEYLDLKKQGHLLSASILAGTVLEVILFEALLINTEIQESKLSNKGLGNLLEISKENDLISDDQFRLGKIVNKARSRVHAKVLKLKFENIGTDAERAFEAFDYLIGELGI